MATKTKATTPSRKRSTRSMPAGNDLPTASLMTTLVDPRGGIDLARAADVFRMSKTQLVDSAVFPLRSPRGQAEAGEPTRDSRVTEMLEIIDRIRVWAGGDLQAMAWYRSQPIPALDGRTSEALVKDGRAAAVRAYLDTIALGGFA